jgi:hypothetical protein
LKVSISAVGAGFYAAGPAETFDADLQSTDWKAAGTATAGWRSAVLVDSGEAGPWSLVSRLLRRSY